MPQPINSEDYKKFLHKYVTKKGHEYTHTSIGNPKICLYVSDQEYPNFIEQYRNAILNGVHLHLTEKPKDPSPFRVDLDFRFAMPSDKKESLNRIYTEYDVVRIVERYCQIFAEYLDYPQNINSFVMEKSTPVEYKGKVKDGIHIIFPDIIVKNSFQHFVRHRILSEANTLFEGLPLTNSYENIIDEAIIDRNNWQMYGSSKPDCEAYRVTRMYSYKESLEKVELPNSSEQLEWVNKLSMRQINMLPLSYKPDKSSEVEEFIRVILPSTLNRRKDSLHQQVFGNAVNLIKTQVSDEELEIAQRLVRCLNKARAENYEDWIKVGWTLRNIDSRLLSSWIEFSEVSNKYVSGECEKIWDRMRLDTLSMGTLRYWAKKDNPNEYDKIDEDNILKLIDRAAGTKGADYDVANVVYTMFRHQYRYTNKDTWYVYREDKHRWECSKDGLQLRKIIYQLICQKFTDRSTYWNQQSILHPENQDPYQAKCKSLLEIALKLKKAGYNDSIIKVCKVLFTDPKFEELLDSRPHLIGFENGVYDLRLHEFREGLPDDYISFCTGRHYIPFNPNSVEVKEIDRFLSQVFTNPTIRKFAMDVFASIFDGGIRHEKFYIFTGSGCHALDTPIMMYDGSIKKVQHIDEGDLLMGDDHTPRCVKQLFRGTDEMYTILPKRGESFQVNGNHILSIQFTNIKSIVVQWVKESNSEPHYCVTWYEYAANRIEEPIFKSMLFDSKTEATIYYENLNTDSLVREGDILDIKVTDLLKWNPKWFNTSAMLYKSRAIPFESKILPIDPYTFGKWLSNQKSTVDSNEDKFYNLLSSYTKHIPSMYKTSSIAQRLELLTGILNAIGEWHAFEKMYTIVIDNQQLTTDIVYLVRSLGMQCYYHQDSKDYHIQIYYTPDKLDTVHTIGFKIEKAEVGAYYGFELDGNHRYVMGDFTVTHNSNGKSKILELVQKAVGDYYCILPIALLTQKRTASNAAQSELERTRGRRFAVMQEPSEGEKMNIGLMKELSGGDTIICRGLFKEPIQFKPQFKMIMTCNELPEVPSDDGGTWRRIRVLHFDSKFTDTPDPNNPKEFPVDTELSDNFDRWADAFLSMMIEIHKTTDLKNISEPMEVRIATESYKKNNDIIGQYISERIVKDETSNQCVMIQAAYTDFKIWTGQNIPKGKRIPDRMQLRAYLEKTFGAYPSDGKGWRGLRYIIPTDNASNVD